MKQVANPRLTDHFGLTLAQSDVDFAIPHLAEDIPLYVDPFLLWKSDKAEYAELHEHLVHFLDLVRAYELGGDRFRAEQLLLGCSEPREVGLGYALGTKRGSAIGEKLRKRILDAFHDVPQLADSGPSHVEVIGLLVPGIAEDRLSDLAVAVLRRFLIDFTNERADRYQIPTIDFQLPEVFDVDHGDWRPCSTKLPYNPNDMTPMVFAPLDLLRHLPWINYEDYYGSSFARLVLPPGRRNQRVSKPAVLAHNRANYEAVEHYVDQKERTAPACHPTPLFEPLTVATLKRKLQRLRSLPSGRAEGQDKEYENLAYDLLSSLLYPELEYADDQVRTVSGVHIRDVIFYNDSKISFLIDLRDRYDAKQLVFELKNVDTLSTQHVNQLHRYLHEEFGRVGVLVARRPPPRAVLRNTVDLHSSKRMAILCLADSDLELMIHLLESGRRPIEAMKKKWIEFTRLLPS